jgi:hypothetical protein
MKMAAQRAASKSRINSSGERLSPDMARGDNDPATSARSGNLRDELRYL